MSDHENPVVGVKNADLRISSEIQLRGMKTTPQQELTSPTLAVSQNEKVSGEIVVDVPSTNWTLEQIAVFVNQLARRRAVDAWRIGTALNLAKSQHKENKNFVVWLKENCPLSPATSYRWMRVAQRLTLEECKDRALNYVYHIIDMEIAEEKKAIIITTATDAQPPIPAAISASESEIEVSEDDADRQPQAPVKKRAVNNSPPVSAKPRLSWSVDEEPELEIEETLEKFQRSVENLVVHKLSEHQRMVLGKNLTSLRAKIDAALLQLAA